MDLQNSLRDYFRDLDETQCLLNQHCRNIQLALQTLQNRGNEELVLQTEDDEDTSSVLSDNQMDEIDILIKKAEQVLVDDIIGNGTKKKNKAICGIINQDAIDQDKAITSRKKKLYTSHKKIANVKSDCTIRNVSDKKVAVTEKNENVSRFKKSNSAVSKVADGKVNKLGTNIHSAEYFSGDLFDEKEISKQKIDEKGISKQKIDEKGISKQKSNKMKSSVLATSNDVPVKPKKISPLYDSTFKEEYCSTRKLRRDLLKLQNEHSLLKQNKEAITEFMTGIAPCNDIGEVPSRLDMNKITHIPCSDEEMKDILESIEMIKNVSDHTIQKYTKCSHLDPYVNVSTYSQNFLINVLTTKELRDLIKLMELRYHLIFQHNLKPLVRNHILQGSHDDKEMISQYHQLYCLLVESNSFPSLVNN